MQQPGNRVLQVAGEMLSIVILALTGRFIGFAQGTLETATPLTVESVLNYVVQILSIFTRMEQLALFVVVLVGASLIRIGLAYANRSLLLGLEERAGIARHDLSWGARAVRFPFAVLYRGLSGIATLVGVLALAICFRMFDPSTPLGFAQLAANAHSIVSGITYGTVGAIAVLFLLYGVALAIIGYIASPDVLSLQEMAVGCGTEKLRMAKAEVGGRANALAPAVGGRGSSPQ
jgi:hypothetical protein